MSIPPTPIPRENPGAGLPYGTLEHAAKYLVVVRQVRLTSLGPIVLSLLLGFVGVLWVMLTHFNAGMFSRAVLLSYVSVTLPAFMLFAAGVALLIAPSRHRIRLVCWNLLLVALILVLAYVFLLLAGERSVLRQIDGLLVFLVLYSIPLSLLTLLRLNRHYAEVALETSPLPLSLTLASNLLNRLRDASTKENPECIEYFTGNRMYRGLLLEDTAVVARIIPTIFKQVIEIHFLPPSDLTIETAQQQRTGRKLVACSFQIDGKASTGSISPESFARYQGWKKRFTLPG